MNIKLVFKDGNEIEQAVRKKKIILGRGTTADIRVVSDGISRQHLEVREDEDGKFFIKDITLGNWVLYNDETMVKGEDVEYFDFCPLELPGGIRVFIQDEETVAARAEATKEISRAQRTTSSAGKRAKITYQKPKSDFKNYMLMSLVFLGIVGYIGYKQYLVYLEQKERNLNRVVNDYERKPKKVKWKNKKINKKVNSKYLEDIKSFPDVLKLTKMSMCPTKQLNDWCNLAMPDRDYRREGLLDLKGALVGVVDVNKRRAGRFDPLVYDTVAKIPDQQIYEIMAANYFLNKKFIKKVKQQFKYDKIYIYVVAEEDLVPVTKRIFVVDFKDDFSYQQSDFKVAIEGVLVKGVPDYYDMFLDRHMIKVK
jgi:hypothetical protein